MPKYHKKLKRDRRDRGADLREYRREDRRQEPHVPSYGEAPKPMPPFVPSYRTDLQRDAHDVFRHSDLSFFLGPAGSGKTYLAVQEAVAAVLRGRASRIVIVRPLVTSGEELGFLPGGIDEKTLPFNLPIYDSLAKLVGKKGPQREAIDAALELCPLAYMRGRTFDDAVVILDEAQNATYAQMTMFVTRLGEGAKMLITGDPAQSDLPAWDRCLEDFVERLRGVEGVGVVRFEAEDIVRHPLISRLLAAL